MLKPKKTITAIAVLASCILGSVPSAGADETGPRFTIRGACSDSEKISYNDSVTDRWRRELDGFLSHKYSAVRGFSNAMAFRKQSQFQAELKLLSEYWLARALWESKMVHVAHTGFRMIASQTPSPRLYGIQLAALECLSRIEDRYSTLDSGANVHSKLPQYLQLASSPEDKEAVWASVGGFFRQQLAENSSKTDLKATLSLLQGAGAQESLARMSWSAKLGDHTGTVNEGQKFLADASRSKSLKRFDDQAHLLLARSFFTTGNYEAANRHLQLVNKRSNELARALSELAWTHLQSEKYADAIGTAMNLQAGGLRHTFAPEAPMVMAMALNELCQYPESLKAVTGFRKYYEKSYRWLETWAKAPGAEQSPLYRTAVAFLNKKASDKPIPPVSGALEVPDRVGSEWVRSPFFIAHQDRINLLFDERDSASLLGRGGAREQRKLAFDIQESWKKLRIRIRDERKKLNPGETLASRLRQDISDLRYDISVYRRYVSAAPAWRTILASHQEKAPSIEKSLVKEINLDLANRTLDMYTQLQEIAENNQLIEVEIYNGASQDIIWQNAHPEYKEIAKQMKEENNRATAEKVWDWGRALAGADEAGGEVWEDELGSFKAELFDNCGSKDKFLAIRKR